jgi:hypothetical protein
MQEMKRRATFKKGKGCLTVRHDSVCMEDANEERDSNNNEKRTSIMIKKKV